MKILCVADTIAPLVYSSHIKERFGDVDMVIGAGDLPMEYLEFIASSLNKPVLFVFGNHNLKRLNHFRKGQSSMFENQLESGLVPESFGSTHIDNTVMHIKGLLIGGLGGSIRYNNGENQFSELQMYFKVFRMIPRMLWNRIIHGRYIDILVAHSAPFGINDKDDPCHRGFKTFLWFMGTFKPRFLLHGHIHLYDQNAIRETSFNGTRIINVYDYYRLTLETPLEYRKA